MEKGMPAVAATVDEYLAGFSGEVRRRLEQVRETVCAAAPEAEEIISYRMPALRMRGILVYYAAFQHHLGFYPPIRGDAALEQAAAPYAGEKGNLRFPHDEPLPLDLIRRLTALRVAQDQARRPKPSRPGSATPTLRRSTQARV